jgi:hypothetical protein
MSENIIQVMMDEHQLILRMITLAERVLPASVRSRMTEAYEKATDPEVKKRSRAIVVKDETTVD